jgi:hypothetical protein
MTALLDAELLKLRTTRTFAALAGAACGLSLLLVTLTASLRSGFAEDDIRALFRRRLHQPTHPAARRDRNHR